jgi:hypothetical protein
MALCGEVQKPKKTTSEDPGFHLNAALVKT